MIPHNVPRHRDLVASPCCPRCGGVGYDYLGEGQCHCRMCQLLWVGVTTTRSARRRRERPLTAQTVITAPIGAELPSGTLPIIITRYWPRGHRKEAFYAWWRELAPLPVLLGAYRQGTLSWPEFAERYTEGLWEHAQRDMYRRRCQDLLQTAPAIALLCHEAAPGGEAAVLCHRRLAQEWLVGSLAAA